MKLPDFSFISPEQQKLNILSGLEIYHEKRDRNLRRIINLIGVVAWAVIVACIVVIF